MLFRSIRPPFAADTGLARGTRNETHNGRGGPDAAGAPRRRGIVRAGGTCAPPAAGEREAGARRTIGPGNSIHSIRMEKCRQGFLPRRYSPSGAVRRNGCVRLRPRRFLRGGAAGGVCGQGVAPRSGAGPGRTRSPPRTWTSAWTGRTPNERSRPARGRGTRRAKKTQAAHGARPGGAEWAGWGSNPRPFGYIFPVRIRFNRNLSCQTPI